MFLRQRFAVNETLVSLLIPFVQFNKDNVNLRRIHAVLGADLDLAEMSTEFAELADDKTVTSTKLPDLVKRLSANADSYPNVLCVMSRILAANAKPHSADVERCINGNNLLKTSLRSGLNIDTEKNFCLSTTIFHRRLPGIHEHQFASG